MSELLLFIVGVFAIVSGLFILAWTFRRPTTPQTPFGGGAVTLCHACGSRIVHQHTDRMIHFTCSRCLSAGHDDVGFRHQCERCSFAERVSRR